jgi:hypothetical protein
MVVIIRAALYPTRCYLDRRLTQRAAQKLKPSFEKPEEYPSDERQSHAKIVHFGALDILRPSPGSWFWLRWIADHRLPAHSCLLPASPRSAGAP